MAFVLANWHWFIKNGMSCMDISTCLFSKIELVHQKLNCLNKNGMGPLIGGHSIYEILE